MSDRTVVEINNLFLKSDRGEDIFHDLNLNIAAGRSAVITGRAGSGKTCLVELLVGSRFPTSGSVEMFGKVVRRGNKSQTRSIRRRIGGVGGIYSLVPALTVAENVVFPLIVSGWRKKKRSQRLINMLTEFGLLKQAGLYPRQLTRVEYTLAMFARASIADQSLLVIDEPSAGLDPGTYHRILDYLVKVALSGRSMLILASEPPSRQLPQTDYYRIEDGALA